MPENAWPPMSTRAPTPRPPGLRGVMRLWFAFEDSVGRRQYLLTGLALVIIKYALEAAIVYGVTGVFWDPVAFFNPVLSMRTKAVPNAPDWLFLALAVLSLPFMWVGISMSVRRAVDAGLSAWVGLVFLVPGVNWILMLALSVLPAKEGAYWQTTAGGPYRVGPPPTIAKALHIDSGLRAALVGVLSAVALGLGMVGLSVYALGIYGTTLFFVTPFVMGAGSAFVFNYPHARTLGSTIGVALMATVLAGCALLLFALEGVICLAMAFPIAAVVAVLGAVVGRAIATRTATTLAQTATMLLCIPFLAGAETKVQATPTYEVITTIEVDAPPDVVWRHVIGFGELDPPAEWVFDTGIAYPMRARLEGEGPGAVRYCEFSTGPFVEPITTWDPPRRLSFDVAAQPPAMTETSPYRHIHPPHLDGSIRSRRGEFRLVELPGGRTRLEGSTWYELSMFPDVYWKFWSDGLLHRIHVRVLEHVKKNAERDVASR